MQKIRWFFLIVGMVLAIALALQNNEPATIQLFWLEQIMPLSVMLLAATGIGFLLGALMTASMLRSRRKKEKEREVREQVAEKEKTMKPETTKPAPSDPPNPLA